MAFVDVSKDLGEERILWMCVLRRAVFDFVLYKGSGKHKLRWQQAHAFIFGDRPMGPAPGLTFSEICGLFGWEPGYVQRLTNSLTRSEIKKLEAAKHKDDLDSYNVEIVDRTMRWNEVDASTPFFLPYHYNEEFREALTPKEADRPPKRHVSFIPLSRWA